VPPLKHNWLEGLVDEMASEAKLMEVNLLKDMEFDVSLPFGWVRLSDFQLVMMDEQQTPEWQAKINAMPPEEQLGYVNDVLEAKERLAR
jgi:hypothetical protein